MFVMLLSIHVLSILLCAVYGAENLVKEGDFEGNPLSVWFGEGATLEKFSWDKHQGSYSILTKDKTENWSGPKQVVSFKNGAQYDFSAWIKVLWGSDDKLNVMMTVKTVSKQGKDNYVNYVVGKISQNEGWTELKGRFTYSFTGDIQSTELKIEGPHKLINFLVDSVSLTEVSGTNSGKTNAGCLVSSVGSDWKTQAYARIAQIRKRPMDIFVNGSNIQNIKLRITQLDHHFGFGTAIDESTFLTNSNYRDFFLSNFDWAVFENGMKWRQSEYNQNQFNFGKVDQVVTILKKNNKKIRGHAIFWANSIRQPDWVIPLKGEAMMNACMKRVDDLLGKYKNSVDHWDVNNEMLHFSFYKQAYDGTDKIRVKMFQKAKQVDPNALLFVNDYNILSWQEARGLVNQINSLRSQGAPISGIGCQGHFGYGGGGRPDVNKLWSDFQTLSSTGLPIWITEFDYESKSDTLADVIEDVMTMSFSHPGVHGFLFWGFSETNHWRGKDAALTLGDNIRPNAAGDRYIDLFHNRWRTKVTLDSVEWANGKRVFHQCGFHGNYKIDVLNSKGSIKKTTYVYLKPSGSAKQINISV